MDLGSLQPGLSMLQQAPASHLFQAAGAFDALSLSTAASRGGIDLPSHLEQLAADGELGGFLESTGEAITLAERSPVFAEQLMPLLGEVRSALQQLPADSLSFTDREAVEATIGDLDALLGAVDTPDAPEVPGGGLIAHEDAGGHLIDRHVGKSEQWLVDRVNRDNISAASSFIDLPEAERLVAETLMANQDGVDAWLDGAGGNRLVIDASFDSRTGISVERGDSQAGDVYSVKLVLERSDRIEDIGFRIVTGYPTAP
ncbi:hypothetical protein LY625_13020 [Lysobacter sp. GX 14042]|uniref:RNase A-like domain-containing protein n=1 Tax=Lysobacter sp. GX 14042 TaxID=2907155 RepID=UPI001F1E9DC7|nr:RNase A-like domain-containing protein [Lysobacter sp. GX 14042]MCE7033523.1 hypothetical protein [Lysobacter sp. GX 14042]